MVYIDTPAPTGFSKGAANSLYGAAGNIKLIIVYFYNLGHVTETILNVLM